MAVRGDFEGLAALRRSVQNASKGKAKLLNAAAAEARTQIALEFRKSVDPDGVPWAPLSYRRGMPLRDTGRLANSFTARATENGFVVGTNVTYATFHQTGARVRKPKKGKSRGKVGQLPGRRIVPEGSLTARWIHAIAKAVDATFRKLWRA